MLIRNSSYSSAKYSFVVILVFYCFQPVFLATCFLDLIEKYLPLPGDNKHQSEDISAAGTSVTKLKIYANELLETNVKNNAKVSDDNKFKELEKRTGDNLKMAGETLEDKFRTPIVHDIDDTPPLLAKSFAEARSESKVDKLCTDKVRIKSNAASAGTHHSWYFVDKQLTTLCFSAMSLRMLGTAFVCCLLPIAMVYCTLELYSLRKKVNVALEKSNKTIPELKEDETQTCSNALSLMDEISSLTEAAMIFTKLKKLSTEIKSKISMREKAEGILTDEFLHVISARIVGDHALKSSLDLLHPETLLGLGQMYQKVMLGKQLNQSNPLAVKVNLGLRVDGSGAIKLKDTEVE